VSHVALSPASRVHNIGTLFFRLGWARGSFHKKHTGTRSAQLCFCIQWDVRVTKSIPVCPGHEMSMHYISCSGEPNAVSIKSAPRHETSNLCF
jgi:hypothetical protein